MVSLPRLLSRTTSGGGSGTGTIILNKYQLGHVLGRGSFAKVYQAKHVEDAAAETVAVKAIDKSLLHTAPLEELLIREVAAMRRLGHHPGILKIHEVLATKTKIYLVMELAGGGELFKRLQKRGRFSESTARVYFLQLISALSFCHQQGIAHRDIKPQNLLLDVNGNLKISDFGLSALPEQLKGGLLQTSCGTPAYTAPEVLNRRAYDGTKADAWSCGVLLYVFLVGSLPFDDSDIPRMRRAMARRAMAFPNWVSKSARSVISKLLDPNPKTRLTIEALMNCNWLKRAKGITKLNEMGFSDLFGDEDSAYNQTKINAFDIISMSPGLNLTGLFEPGITRKELRFATENKVVEIEAKVETVGTELGFKVERGKCGGMGLVKGSSLLRVGMSEMVNGLWMVELKVVEGRRVTEFEATHWMQLKAGLKEIAISWHEKELELESVVSVE